MNDNERRLLTENEELTARVEKLSAQNELLRTWYLRLNELIQRFDDEVQDLYASLGSR